jgi:misacylated tRNA(Ala) deacylase
MVHGMVCEPLYISDSYLREFNARIVRSGPRYAVLDRTAFYPEGGGQPSDTGVLNWDNETVKVYKVMKRGAEIFHYLENDIPKDVIVKGTIEWGNRFWNMRRHSAEHLLTGLLENEGYGPKTYSDLERLEFRNSKLENDKIRLIEKEFNRLISKDLPIRIFYKDRESIDVERDPRKKSFLEKIPHSTKQLRMVEIESYALTFCMGTHVKSTGEIGPLKLLRLEDARKGRQVLYFNLRGEGFQ